jgi:hypothetical protein
VKEKTWGEYLDVLLRLRHAKTTFKANATVRRIKALPRTS